MEIWAFFGVPQLSDERSGTADARHVCATRIEFLLRSREPSQCLSQRQTRGKACEYGRPCGGALARGGTSSAAIEYRLGWVIRPTVDTVRHSVLALARLFHPPQYRNTLLFWKDSTRWRLNFGNFCSKRFCQLLRSCLISHCAPVLIPPERSLDFVNVCANRRALGSENEVTVRNYSRHDKKAYIWPAQLTTL